MGEKAFECKRGKFRYASLALRAGIGAVAASLALRAGMVVLVASQAVCAQDWSRMLGPTNNGKIPKQPIRFDWTGELKLVWQVEVGEGYGNAVIKDGRVYHFDRYDQMERLTCYSLADAKEQWRQEFPVDYIDSFGYNNGPRAMPVVNDKYAVAYGAAGRLIVTDAITGDLNWQKEVSKEYQVEPNFFGVGSTPCIYKNMLIVMVGGAAKNSKKLSIGRLKERTAGDSGIVAFDLESGKEIYRTGSYLASYSAPVIQSIDGRDVGLALMREGLFAFDPATGAELDFYPWRASINESVNAAWPVVDGNDIFISETYEIGSTLLSLRKNEFVERWKDSSYKKDQAFRAHWATPVLIDGILYGCSGRNEPDSDIRAVKWNDGEVLWSKRTHARLNVVAIGDHLIALDENGLLQLIKPNPEKLDILGEMELFQSTQGNGGSLVGSPVWAPPAIADGKLLIRGGKSLIALQLSDDKN